jgi:hypothetical protein
MRSQSLFAVRLHAVEDLHFVSLCSVAEISLEQGEEIVHFNSEFLTPKLVSQIKQGMNEG